MSKPLKRYTVIFLDALRVQVDVTAHSPKAARAFAIKEWSDALWEMADPQLENPCCTIIESDHRDFLEVHEELPSEPSINESTAQ